MITWYKIIYGIIYAHRLARLYPTLCDRMDSSPPGSSVYGIFQARIQEWIVVSYAKLIVSPFICMYYIFINNGINSLLLILGMMWRNMIWRSWNKTILQQLKHLGKKCALLHQYTFEGDLCFLILTSLQ